ncbi:MAG: EamA family transporter [Alphaproteobacteria bacterium]|nr:EamA family transporter [Alphaproteobacteria bacterium]
MIYAILPIFAAMLYGLAFALMEKALQITNVVTYMLIGSAISIPLVLALVQIKKEPLDFGFLQNKMDALIVLLAVIAPAAGWFLTAYTIKNVNAGYAAFAEVSYPLFTIIFLFVLFGIKHFEWHLLLGGSLVMLGSFILVMGQMKAGTG